MQHYSGVWVNPAVVLVSQAKIDGGWVKPAASSEAAGLTHPPSILTSIKQLNVAKYTPYIHGFPLIMPPSPHSWPALCIHPVAT